MKRILAVLMMATCLGACTDSTTDVARVPGGGGDDGGWIPPDTIIRGDRGFANVYGPGNAFALQREAALLTDTRVAERMEQFADRGLAYESGRAYAITSQTAEGEPVTLTVFPMMPTGDETSVGHVLDMQVGEAHLVRALLSSPDASAPDGVATETLPFGKSGPGPQENLLTWKLASALACVGVVLVNFSICLFNCCLNCHGSSVSFWTCATICQTTAVTAMGSCLTFAMH